MSKNVTITEAILLAAEQLAIPVSIKEVMNSVDTRAKQEHASPEAMYRDRVTHALPGLSDETITSVAARVKQLIEAGTQ
ncbi:MAG: hypothetical protein FWB85_05265 [Chitinispirillia bacterium]|nr:hypothetical protein [Chitinispirillia bacterium]